MYPQRANEMLVKKTSNGTPATAAAMNDTTPSAGGMLRVPSGPYTIGPPPNQDERLQLSIILPTYNEAKNLEEMVRRLTGLLDGKMPSGYEIIVVDDNSPDGTAELALRLTSGYPQLRVMRRVDERGLSTAVIRGWQAAR